MTDGKQELVPISADVLLDLIWWVDPQHLLASTPLQQPVVDLQPFTNVSTQRWGAHLLHLEASGLWTPEQTTLHIIELQAVKLGLESFLELCKGKTSSVMSDNCTFVLNIRKQDRTRSWDCGFKHSVSCIGTKNTRSPYIRDTFQERRAFQPTN